MKKTKLWKRIAGFLLVFLLVLQLPVNAFAEEVTCDDQVEISTDGGEASRELAENANSESSLDSDAIEESEESEAASEEDIIEEDTKGLTEETDETDSSEIETDEENTELSEIEVRVSISKDGKFLDDKDGNAMAGRTVTLSGQSSYTMDDALKAAHDLYYQGGAEAGYDFHEDESGNYDGLIYKLWGYDKDSVPAIRFSLNNDCGSYVASLTQTIKDGDSMHFYIQQRKAKDKLAFFTETEETITQGESITLRLRQSTQYGTAATDGNVFSNCSDASIYIDGVKQENLVTDENGQVTINSLEARDTPYFITAEKLVDLSDGTTATAITAAYANVTVVSATGQTGNYIKGLSFKVTSDDVQKEYQIESLDGENGITLPANLSHGNFYLKLDGEEEIPESCSIYAVYTNPRDETVCRVKLKEDSYTYLKNTSQIYTYKAIQSIKLEVRQNGEVIQTAQLPISYKTNMKTLLVRDSWGHDIDCNLATDTLDDQQLEVTVPQNSEYIAITGEANSWGHFSYNQDLISINNGAQLAYVSNVGFEFVPDWSQYSEYVVTITLPVSEKKYISQETKYTLTIKPGDTDYTPVLSYEGQKPGDYSVFQNDQADAFVIQPTVLRSEEGKLSYQWYEREFRSNDFKAIEGANSASYQLSTSEPRYCFLKCVVSYEIDGKSYSIESDLYRVQVYPLSLDAPQITSQPTDMVCVKGMPLEESLSVEVKANGNVGASTKYQWYKNTEDSSSGGTLIPGATSSSYTPDVSEIGQNYYYCRVRYTLEATTNTTSKNMRSSDVYSDTACVTVTAAPLSWDGEGTEEFPYLIKSSSDLEELRDKVNSEGFSFEDTYFQLTEDITLPSNWKPIGVTKDGKKDLKSGSNLNAFSGIFDGNGHTITVPEGGLPLFGYVRNTRIRNLNIYGKKIAGYGLVNNFEGVGLSGTAVEIDNVTLKSGSSTLKSGLIGANKTMSAYAGCSSSFEASIKNCTIEEGVVVGYDKDQTEIGAIAGRMQGTVENCVSYATVYGSSYVGGIIGTRDNAMGNCSVIGCKFYGTVEASGELAGGIAGGGYDDSSAPNGCKITINSCSSVGTVMGSDKVGGILGGDLYVAQTWDNCSYSLKNNSFTGKLTATKEDASYVGGIIGYYDSLNRIDVISNNYYAKDCGADKGIGFVKYIDTNCDSHETASGATYICTETDVSGCPEVTGCGWQTGYNRSDDPLGADLEKLFSSEGLNSYVESLQVSGDYRTVFYLGEELDLSGMTVVAKISDGSQQELSLTDLTIEGYKNDQRGEQTLRLSYEEAFADITVKVLKKDAGDITVSFTLLGDSAHESTGDDNCHTLRNNNLETWIAKKDYTLDGNATVLDLLKMVLSENGMTLSAKNDENYISGITKDGVELAEFTNGQNSGWMYTLNGLHPDLGVKEQYLEDGDEIVFHYTDDYTKEHDHEWEENWTYDANAHWHECTDQYGNCDITDNSKKGSYQKHSYGSGKEIKAATFSSTGQMQYTCKVCGYVKTETIPKLKSSIKLNVSSITLQKKQTTTKVKVTMAKGDSIKSWSSSNKKIVTVDKKGKIKAGSKTGTAKITVTLKSGKKTSLKVKVQSGKVKTKKLTGLKSKMTIKKGKSSSLKPVLSPITSQEKVTYSSSNKKIASVSAKGVIKGKKKGTAYITVKSGKVSKKIKVTVK